MSNSETDLGPPPIPAMATVALTRSKSNTVCRESPSINEIVPPDALRREDQVDFSREIENAVNDKTKLLPIKGQARIDFLREATKLCNRLIASDRAIHASAHALLQSGEGEEAWRECENRLDVDWTALQPMSKIVTTLVTKYPMTVVASDLITVDGCTRDGNEDTIYINSDMIELGASAVAFPSPSLPYHLLHAGTTLAHEWQHQLRRILVKTTAPPSRVSIPTPSESTRQSLNLRREFWDDGGGWAWELAVIGGRMVPTMFPLGDNIFLNEYYGLELLTLTDDETMRSVSELHPVTAICEGHNGWEAFLPFPKPTIPVIPGDHNLDDLVARAKSRVSVKRVRKPMGTRARCSVK